MTTTVPIKSVTKEISYNKNHRSDVWDAGLEWGLRGICNTFCKNKLLGRSGIEPRKEKQT